MQGLPIIQFTGGLFIFLYGMHAVRSGLERASGDKLRSYINRLVRDRVRSFLMGVVSTFIMESSGAATVMFVGFASVGLLDLFQSISLTAGATVGTTLFVIILAHFISYDLTNFSLLLIIAGFIVTILKKKGTVRYLGDSVIGLGILFLGVFFMIKSVSNVGGSQFFRDQINMFAENPLWGIFVSAVFTAVIHSSTGAIGIALSLTTLNLIDLNAALPIVIGANIGTCSTAILASLNSTVGGKRLAWAHLIMKLAGALLLFPFLGYYADFIKFLTPNLNYQVALSHFFMNFFNSILVLALLTPFVKLVVKLIPEEEEEEGSKFSVKFLDPSALDTPAVAFGNVMRELLRMADINEEMLRLCMQAFEKNNMSIVEKLEEMDDDVDMLNREIKFYLAKITQSELTPKQAKKEMNLVNITNNMEIIGDILTKTIMELAVKKIKKGLEFSQDGWNDIKNFHAKVVENFHIAVTSLASNNLDLAKKAIRNKKKIVEMEDELKQSHFLRLASGMKESFLTSSIHLELLGHLRRVNSYITKVAQIVSEQ